MEMFEDYGSNDIGLFHATDRTNKIK